MTLTQGFSYQTKMVNGNLQLSEKNIHATE